MAKRLFDIVLATAGLAIASPFMLIIAIVLRLTGEGEVFYAQERVGRGNRPFRLLKFATMVKDSPRIGAGDVTLKDDPRVLRVGRVLRKTKLNEVPQFLNIVGGSMSFVGPRPQTPKNLRFFSPEDQELILRMRPGLTGMGSIVFRDEENIVATSGKPVEVCMREDIAPYKAALERWYFAHQGIGTDLLILLVTAWVVFFPRSVLYRSIWKDLPGRQRQDV